MKFGPSINDVSLEGEGGGPPSKPIYYISLFSNLSQQGEGGGGGINSEKWADVVYEWPLTGQVLFFAVSYSKPAPAPAFSGSVGMRFFGSFLKC